MKAELKAKWIAALRSGEYKQGMGGLRRYVYGDVVYCCLGVVCEVMGYHYRSEVYETETGHVVHVDKLVVGDFENELALKQQAHLAEMNDRGWTFTDIADWIEANVEATS